MRRSRLYILLVLAGAAIILSVCTELESEQVHSGDNCRGCHGNRYTQRAVITDAVVPESIDMGENATVEITVKNDCRHQGQEFYGDYSDLDEAGGGTNLWLTPASGLVFDDRDGNPAYFSLISSQQEKTADWTITGEYDLSLEDFAIEGVREVGETITFKVTARNSGGGNERLDIRIEGHNSHENELQITEDEYYVLVENTTMSATVDFILNGEIIDSFEVNLGDNEEETLETSWAAEEGEHDVSVEIVGVDYGETDHSNNEISDEVAVWRKADLFVEEMEYSPEMPVSGQEVEVSETVANGGEKSAVFEYSLEVHATDTPEDVIEYLNGSTEIEGGGSDSLVFSWNSSTYDPGNYTLSLHLDPDDQVLEISEDNNSFAVDIELVEPPDLADGAVLSLELPPGQLFESDGLPVLARVQNIGDGWLNITAVIQIDDTTLLERDLSLEPFEEIELNAIAAPGTGFHTIVVNLSGADVDEASLDNNVMSKKITVLSLPELSVVGITPLDTTPVAGELIPVSVAFSKGGEVELEFGYTFSVDGSPVKIGSEQVVNPGSLLLNFNWIATEGLHNLSISIENITPARIIRNSSFINVQVARIEFEIVMGKLTVLPESPVAGDAAFFKVELEYQDTLDFTVRFFVDGSLIENVTISLSGARAVEGVWPVALQGTHLLEVETVSTQSGATVSKALEFQVHEADSVPDGTQELEDESEALAGSEELFYAIPAAAIMVPVVMLGRMMTGKRKGAARSRKEDISQAKVHWFQENDDTGMRPGVQPVFRPVFQPGVQQGVQPGFAVEPGEGPGMDVVPVAGTVGLAERMLAPRPINEGDGDYEVSSVEPLPSEGPPAGSTEKKISPQEESEEGDTTGDDEYYEVSAAE